jgi:fructose-1,6-bisphosphatase II
MDRNLALEVVRVTEAAAMASARLMGRGDRGGAARAAAEAIRRTLAELAIDGEVVIGEGEPGRAPLLYTGERLGRARPGDLEIEIAVDALEGKNLCATGAANAVSVVAMAEKGKLLRVPDLYMEKIAVGPGARGAVDLARPPTENMRAVADALGKYVEDLTVVILDRPRNGALIAEVRATGARIKLITDGDLAGALSTCFPETGVDLLMGIGGAPEGVISAVAVRCAGGDLQGRLRFRSEEEREQARAGGLGGDLERVLEAEELAAGHVMLAATGVTNGDFLKGVHFTPEGARTHSVVMRSKTGSVRFIDTQHRFRGTVGRGRPQR